MSALDSTYGIWLVSLFLATILYGCGLLQTWLYFHWYSNDRWIIRTMVVVLLILESLQISFLFASTYFCLITNFGNIPELFVINWMDDAQLLCGYLSAFTVQLYFASCIYMLNKKNLLAPLLITSLALIQIGAGIAQLTATIKLGSFLNLESTKHTTTLQSAATLCCDVAITVCLLRTLSGNKSSIRSTNTMLNMLMVNAVNRGILTAVSACLNMVLFLSIPNTFYFFLGLMTSSKLYMNSALATLNSRQHIRNKTHPNANSSQGWPSIPLEGWSAKAGPGGSRTQIDSRDIQVTVDTETCIASTDEMSKSKTFIDGML